MNEPTAPLVARAPMHAHPWSGLTETLARLAARLLALASPRSFAPHFGGSDSVATSAWTNAAHQRRRVLMTMLLGVAAAAVTLAPEGMPSWHVVLQALLLAWVALGLATALMGAWVMLRGDAHALKLRNPAVPIDKAARTALVMPICNEDIATVFGGLSATCESLAATGALELFDIYVLSDTSDPALRAAEMRAWERLRSVLGDAPVRDGGRVFYRWRRRRTRRKAGNVADFCRRWGKLYRYMVVLDADSTMSGATLLALVRLMEQHPQAGIVQTLPQAGGHPTLHARLQQFASRVTGRLFALGLAYWQLGDSHYWGHNAILRVQPFMRHCGLAPLSGRGGLAGDILSHDFVEAALMRRAGYEVWLAPQLSGSWEQQPPNLLAELQRDRRWCQGNLQNARLLAEPGWQLAHRAMFAAGALSYAVAPLWLGFVAVGLWWVVPAVHDAGAWALWLLTAVLLLLPRALGVTTVCLLGEQKLYGGTGKLLASAALEALLAAIQAPLRMLAHSLFVVGALTGLRLEWRSPPRDAARVGWGDAAAGLGIVTLPMLLLLLWASSDTWRQGWQGWHIASQSWPLLLSLLLPLLLAVPYTVWTGSAAIGHVARRLGLLLTPDEHQPPRTLLRAADADAFERLHPRPAARSAVAAVPWFGAGVPGLFGPPRVATALALTTMLCLLSLAPRPGFTPGLSPELSALWHAPTPHLEAELLPAPETLATDLRPAPRARPAQRINDDVRRRAMREVQRALGAEDYERLIASLANAADIAP
jgi:membrane glycosyltransferase